MYRYAEVTRTACNSDTFALTHKARRPNFLVYRSVLVCSPFSLTAMRSNALVSMNLLNGAHSGSNGVSTRRTRMWLG